MDKLEQFIQLLEEEVSNKSIYVWGGNGESIPTLNEKLIRRKEASTGRAEEAVATFNARIKAGYTKIKCFDCSGLGYYCLKKLGLLKSRYNANKFYQTCTKIEKKELCKGCFVFHLREDGTASHIGYVVDDKLNVIEALGRSSGVVKRAFSKGKWVAYGKPTNFFQFETKTTSTSSGAGTTTTSARLIKLTSPLMRGDDVLAVQKKLVELGYSLTLDGIYGAKTAKAIKDFQKKNGLQVDGIIGEKTLTKLGV